jgi:hypothetical protein
MEYYDAGIVFGSCNRQNLPQMHWLDFQERRTKRFLWLGDAVYGYPSGKDIAGLRKAFVELVGESGVDCSGTMCSPYIDFLYNRSSGISGNQSIVVDVDGVWDDHDMGINDGGKYVPDLLKRKAMYTEFLLNKKLEAKMDPSIKMYKTKDFKLPIQSISMHDQGVIAEKFANIRVVFLDTRSYRDDHFLSNIGEYERVPYSAYGAAISRCFSTYSGLVDYHDGDLLGDEQWRWLESILLPPKESDDSYDFNVIISSIQVLTTNCIVESWGHFPKSKKKLLDLIARSKLKGLSILSGDVHHGEISISDSQSSSSSSSSSSSIVEVTSSGLTHSCSNCNISTDNCSPNELSLCKIILDTFHRHRETPNSYYTLPNYGYMYVKEGMILNLSVRDIKTHEVVLSSEIKSEIYNLSSSYHDFPTIWSQNNGLPVLNFSIYFTLAVTVATLFYFFRRSSFI